MLLLMFLICYLNEPHLIMHDMFASGSMKTFLESESDAAAQLSGRHAPQTSHRQISFFGGPWKTLFIVKNLVLFRNWKLKSLKSLRKLIANSANVCVTQCLLDCNCALFTRLDTLNIASKTACYKSLFPISFISTFLHIVIQISNKQQTDNLKTGVGRHFWLTLYIIFLNKYKVNSL